ncbi:hypothetical protein BJ138DRAFT_1020727, partial [Hygrophoropsis aurantiaca]
RPHCLAKDRLRLWLPEKSRALSQNEAPDQIPDTSDIQLDRILEVIGASWAPSTKETYGAGLLVFHVYCDMCELPESARCPLSLNLLTSFVASCAGSYSGSTLASYTAGLRAWHLLHGVPWHINTDELKAVLEGATRLAPPSSKIAKRSPFTPAILTLFRSHMQLDKPQDAAIFACMTVVFYGVARLGEFTVNSLKSFDPVKHVTCMRLSQETDRNGLLVTKIHVPSTKSSPSTGEDVQFAVQQGLSDPIAALENHLRINKADPSAHLFAWLHHKGLRPLTKRDVTKRITEIANAHAGLPNLKGHSLRIGGTLEYLLRGVPFDVVKTMGRWSSEAFTIYLRQHAQILAPYLQATPLLEPFTRYTMPPVR